MTSQGARTLLKSFAQALGDITLDDDLRGAGTLAARHQLAEAWLAAYLGTGADGDPADVPEAVATLLCASARYDSPPP